MQNLAEVTLWQGEYEYFLLLKSEVMIDFNCNAIRTFYIKLIFIDDVGLGREHRIREMKALRVYEHAITAFHAN